MEDIDKALESMQTIFRSFGHDPKFMDAVKAIMSEQELQNSSSSLVASQSRSSASASAMEEIAQEGSKKRGKSIPISASIDNTSSTIIGRIKLHLFARG